MAGLVEVLRQLRMAREKAVREVERLDTAISALAGSRDGTRPLGRSRPRLSAAARRRISQAQKARWAKVRAQRKGEKKAA